MDYFLLPRYLRVLLVGQPPRLSGTAPFLPHGIVPIPSLFPPGLPPQIGALPLAGTAATPKPQNCVSTDVQGTNTSSNSPQA